MVKDAMAFHQTFNSLFFISTSFEMEAARFFTKQYNLIKNTMAKIARGETFRHGTNEKERNDRITTLIAAYTSASADALLRGIALNYMIGS